MEYKCKVTIIKKECYGFIYVGIDLEKRDWLTFFGAYLTFAGTLIISLIAILQSKYFTDIEKNMRKNDRMKVL